MGFLICPRTATFSFARVPELKLDGLLFPSADAHLLEGKHKGRNWGFGAKHIWAEHHLEMAKFALYSLEDVPIFVQKVVQPNTPLHYEGGPQHNKRVIAVRSHSGTAVLEWREHHDLEFWSIVTVYLSKNPRGQRIGRLVSSK